MAKQTGGSRPSRWWALIALGIGFPVAFGVGQFLSSGTAEIAGIMASTLVFCVRAFWDFHVKRWYFAVIAGWAAANLLILIFLVVPMRLSDSRALINLVWVEFFAFAGLLWLATRVWGGLPDEADGR